MKRRITEVDHSSARKGSATPLKRNGRARRGSSTESLSERRRASKALKAKGKKKSKPDALLEKGEQKKPGVQAKRHTINDYRGVGPEVADRNERGTTRSWQI